MVKFKPWNMTAGLAFVRRLERELTGNADDDRDAHVALAGGVMKRGRSAHDLDVIVYPRNSENGLSLLRLHKVMKQIGCISHATTDMIRADWKRRGITDRKHVEVWRYRGRRVDLIVVRG